MRELAASAQVHAPTGLPTRKGPALALYRKTVGSSSVRTICRGEYSCSDYSNTSNSSCGNVSRIATCRNSVLIYIKLKIFFRRSGVPFKFYFQNFYNRMNFYYSVWRNRTAQLQIFYVSWIVCVHYPIAVSVHPRTQRQTFCESGRGTTNIAACRSSSPKLTMARPIWLSEK
jgi:hypothetical protein